MNVMYKLKQLIPIATLATAALLLTSCNKDDDDTAVQQKHHNTTYIWGDKYWDEVWPADKVAASADSVLVDTVFLKNDGESMGGTSTSITLSNLNMIINKVAPQNRHKIRGAGTLNKISIGNQETYQDSIVLANMGFKFGRVLYANNFR